jgi:hypothetical protein
LSDSLQPLTDELYAAYAPQHIRHTPQDRPRLHAAWLAAIAAAFSLHRRILVDCILGFVTVGNSPPSGAFPENHPHLGKGPPTAIRFSGTPFASLDHAEWNDELASSATDRLDAADRPGAPENELEGIKAVWEATMRECAKGTMAGPFTRAESDTAYRRGRSHASRRFPV